MMKTIIKTTYLVFSILATNHMLAQVDVLPSGEVGIGNSNPNYKLDVNGSINFSDSLYQNGIPVELEGASHWTGNDTMIGFEGKVGVGTNTPQAAFEVESTTGGFLPPRLSEEEINTIENPIAGTIIFDTDKNCLALYTGEKWEIVRSIRRLFFLIGNTIKYSARTMEEYAYMICIAMAYWFWRMGFEKTE